MTNPYGHQPIGTANPYGHKPIEDEPVEKQRLRALASGATLGHVDEVLGGVRTAGDLLTNRPYDFGGGVSMDTPTIPERYATFRNDEREKLNAYRDAYPAEATTIELAGAALPAIVTKGQSAKLTLQQMMARGAGYGALGAYGYSEGETTGRQLMDTVTGAAFGSMMDPTISTAGAYLGGKAAAVYSWARERLGDKVASRVADELRRLVESTGKTADEIVDDVASGEVMAENRTLAAVVRAFKGEGDEAGALVTKRVPERRAKTRSEAEKSLRGALAPDIEDKNVMRWMRSTDDDLGEAEKESYKKVFGDNSELGGDALQVTQDTVQRVPAAREALQAIYSADETLAPLFKVAENGAITFHRVPQVRDAEIVRRVLSERARASYKDSQGTLGEVYKNAEKKLRTVLDKEYPELDRVRSEAAQRRLIRDSFDEGRQVFSKSVDEVSVIMEDMEKKGLAASRAYRLGAMDAVRNKMNRQKNSMVSFAEPQAHLGGVVREVAPQRFIPDIDAKTARAGASQEMYDKVMHNSMTQPTQAAAGQIGRPPLMSAGRAAVTGGASAIADMLGGMMRRNAPTLGPAEREQVVRVLFSENPDLVKRALIDETAMKQLGDIISAMANQGGRGALRSAQAGQAQAANSLLDVFINERGEAQ